MRLRVMGGWGSGLRECGTGREEVVLCFEDKRTLISGPLR